ncbi:hypothetical protein Tco_1124921 [Tanacetum coccineum]|uniref:Xylulose kinase-1 n=1 Tax=Tanacetum coccineum TaxID=301880 RepID=A0ABQ5J855_9ASTR
MVAYLKRTEGSKGFHQIVDFLNTSHIRYALTENPTIYVYLIQQFWQTATTSILDNGEIEITATIDGKIKIVTEASIRRHLKLEDYDGPNFEGEGSTVPVESHHTPTSAPSTSQPHISPTLRSSIRQKNEVPQPSSPPHTNVADEAASTGVDVRYGGAATTVAGLKAGHDSGNIDKTRTMPHDSPLLRVHTLRSDEGRMQHNELIDLVTKLSDRVVALKTGLTQTKKVYGDAFIKLINKVKRLEKKDTLSKLRRKLRLVLSDEEGLDSDILAQEDPSKQGRKIAQINEDEGITLVQMGVSTASTDLTTTHVLVTTAGAEISTASPEVKTASDSVDDIAAKSLVYISRSATKKKDKGKGIMEESESVITKTKRQQEQERLGYEAALRLQEQLNEEERQRIARAHEVASSFNIEEWEDIQARIEASEELAQRLQAEEKEKYSEAEKARLLAELINQRKRHFSQQRAKERRNKPPTQVQDRETLYAYYIKHMGSYTLQQLRGYSFDEIKSMFEATMKRVNTFTPMESDVDRIVPKIAARSTKRAAEEELGQQSSKKQMLDELSQEELQQLMITVPEEGINIEALQTKYPIIDWEVYTEDSRMY